MTSLPPNTIEFIARNDARLKQILEQGTGYIFNVTNDFTVPDMSRKVRNPSFNIHKVKGSVHSEPGVICGAFMWADAGEIRQNKYTSGKPYIKVYADTPEELLHLANRRTNNRFTLADLVCKKCRII